MTSAVPPAPTTDTRRELVILFRLAGPIMLAQLGLIAMSLVDTAYVGRTSVDQLAGTSVGSTIVFLCCTLGMGITQALEPLASQAIGAGDPARAYAALRTTVRACVLLFVPSALLALASLLVLPAFRVAPEIIPAARAFLWGRVPSILFFFLFLAGKTFLQAHGETRPALIAALVGNAVNVVVCALLVLGDRALRAVHLPPLGLPALGALGAGLANTIASAVLAAVVLVAVWKKRQPADPAVSVPLARVFQLGLPMGLQFTAEVGAFSLVGVLAGRLGSQVVSAHQIALGLASFTFMGALGVSGATAVRVGHAVGAGVSPRRVGLLGIATGASVMALGAAAFTALPEQLVRVFTNDPAVIATGVTLLRIAALFQLFDGTQAVGAGALRGAGDVRFPFVANVLAHWGVGFPIAMALGFGLGMGAPGLWWGLTAGLVAIGLALATRFAWISRGPLVRV